jgi:putative nucleotidyltransferase with HDIG domain
LAGFLVALIALAGVSYLRYSQQEAQFKAVRSSVLALLNLQAEAINDGFFSWSVIRTDLKTGNLGEAEALLSEIKDTYPFVDKVELVNGVSPAKDSDIQGQGTDFILTFSIKDDRGQNKLPDWKAQISIKAQTILDSLHSDRRIVIDPQHGQAFVYSLKAGFENGLLGWMDYLIIVLATFAIVFPVSLFLWRRNLYFYESKGLESIIFLFEQTEKLSANHSRQVAALAAFVGEKMGYSGSKLRNLYTAALLHDIGKVSIPSDILLKEGPLTKEEQTVIKTHPIVSARILRNFKELSHLSPIVLYHQERMDGSGYPEGLNGQEIPEAARIIAVVDVFEALTGDRPYRESLYVKEAFMTMRGMPLDRRIVAILEAEFEGFKTYHSPKWVVAYDRTLKNA